MNSIAWGWRALALLREQTELGMTIVMVTHERSLAEKVADRLAIMGDGKLASNSLASGPIQ
jgi:ABC-type polar amino acid transport system ATPase subunit